MSKVERRGPGEVLLHDVGAVDLQFPTRAFGLATVFGDVARTVDGRDGTIEQQVLGARPIGVERTRDAVVQEGEINTEVHLSRSLPAEGGRSKFLGEETVHGRMIIVQIIISREVG